MNAAVDDLPMPVRCIRLLLVEGNADDAALVCAFLAEAGAPRFEVVQAAGLDEAIDRLEKQSFDVVLSGFPLTGCRGMAGLEALVAAAGGVPLVAMTQDPVDPESAHAGVHGYLVNGELRGPALVRAIVHAIEQGHMIRKVRSGREREVHLASHDMLTGLPNRALLLDRLGQAVATSRRGKEHVCVLFLDLDRFKSVNDTLGHAAGDELLRRVARRLESVVRETDTVARLGGDEFVIVYTQIKDSSHVHKLTAKILSAFEAPIDLDGVSHYVTPSIGSALFPDDADDASLLLQRADIAMYHAKDGGRNQCCAFLPEMEAQAGTRASLYHQLSSALSRRQFELLYQPIVDVRENRIVGAEALLRWRSPEHGLVPPLEFLEMLEETGLIVPIGEWIVTEACRQVRAWEDAGHPGLRIAVNIAPRQLQGTRFVPAVVSALSEAGLAPDRLDLEITESALIEDAHATVACLEELKAFGVRLSLDDFGTGYSSLAYLKRLPLDALKIDRCFVFSITDDPADAMIVTAVQTIARGLGFETVAEGVETEGQMEALVGLGTTLMQGYHFGQPLAVEDFLARLAEPAIPRDKSN